MIKVWPVGPVRLLSPLLRSENHDFTRADVNNNWKFFNMKIRRTGLLAGGKRIDQNGLFIHKKT